MLAATMPSACGMKRKPETVAEAPSEVWMKVGRNCTAEKSTALERSAISPVSTYMRLRKSIMGMMAWGWPRSRRTKRSMSAPAPPSSPSVGAPPQPKDSPAQAMASRAATVAPVSRPAPAKSMSPTRPPWRTFGSVRQMKASATAPMGRFTKKHQRQPSPSVRKPPTGGPTSVPAVITARM